MREKGSFTTMKKIIWLSIFTLALGMAAMAQDYPKAEVFGGYSFAHSTFDTGGLGGIGNIGVNLNGGSGSISFNPNKTLGLVADFGIYHGTPDVLGVGVGLTHVSYLFGPKLAMRSNEKVTPFFHALFGGVHEKASANIPGFGSFSSTDNAFAMALGGGIDAKVHNNIAIRVVQAEYLLTKFNDLNNNRQNGVRISTGIVFRLGS
jgi:opacity protein-like surface antigen